MPPLLLIETERVRLELRGPHKASGAWGTAGGQLSVTTQPPDGSVAVQWIASNGSQRFDLGGPGPAIFEWTTYELFVESLTGAPVSVNHRDPRLLARVVSPTGHPEMVSGPVSFRGQVGMTQLGIRCDGALLLNVEIEVFPAKLDYASDYDALLSEVNTASRALALEYLRATYRHGTEERGERPTDLEFATLLRHHLKHVARAMAWIARHPHRRLVREATHGRVERLQRPSRLTKNAIRQRRGSGPLVAAPGLGNVRARVPGMRAFETLNTAEHRWLRSALLAVSRRVDELAVGVASEVVTAQKSGRSSVRLEAEAAELTAARALLGGLLRLEPMAAAVGSVPRGFSSLTLLRMPGYREAVRGLLALGNGLSLKHGSIETSVKDIEVLYEFWCFLRLATLLYESVGGQADFSALFEGSASGLRTRFAQGRELELALSGGTRYRLTYNRSFPGFTGTQRPDLLLILEHDDWPAMYVALDAKYRVDASETYVKQFELPGPPEDAINQLHRYRDAIVLEHTSAERSRPVVKGAALFPLDAATSASWFTAPLAQSLDRYGIGALPFLPFNDGHVRAWLQDLLGKTPHDLSWPGPPFAAAAETRRRQEHARTRTLLVTCSGSQLQAWRSDRVVDLALPSPHAAVVEQIVAVVEDPATNTTHLAGRSQIVSVASHATGLTTFNTAQWEPIDSVLTGIGLPGPAVTSQLAISRSRSVGELGLSTVGEWDLVELLRRSGYAVSIATARSAEGRLAARFYVDSPAGLVTVDYSGPAGFTLSDAGGDASSHPSARDVLDALPG